MSEDLAVMLERLRKIETDLRARPVRPSDALAAVEQAIAATLEAMRVRNLPPRAEA